MSLLQSISYKEYKKALALTTQQCEQVARYAGLSIQFSNSSKPGELLMKELDKTGCTPQRYAQLLSTLNVKTILTYYRPQAKVAILVANDKYTHLSKLATPSVDCDSIGLKLRDLGFIVITVKNTMGCILRQIFRRVCELIPEDSYAFIFYAGHGCQICNTKCLLGIDCPMENIHLKHCITENYILKEMEKCKLDLCVLIMDMCRVHLDRLFCYNPKMCQNSFFIRLSDKTRKSPSVVRLRLARYHWKHFAGNISVQTGTQKCLNTTAWHLNNWQRAINPQIYESVSFVEEYSIHKNLLVSYSCQSAAAAYEVLQIECSTTIDTDVTYELKTGDTDKIVPGASQYVNALCTRLCDDLDVSTLLDKVHADVEHSVRKQRALKIQCGVDKRSLYDPVSGETEELTSKLQEVAKDFSDCCMVL